MEKILMTCNEDQTEECISLHHSDDGQSKKFVVDAEQN